MALKRAITVLILLFFISSHLPCEVLAQGIVLPPVGQPVLSSAKINPMAIKGLKVDSSNPLRFEFILDNANLQPLASKQEEMTQLVKFFLAALAIPEEDLWVNLSPYEGDRIIPETLGATDLGRGLLAQDYVLKQLSASLMDPRTELGKKFWDRVYKTAQDKWGATAVPVNTFNKIWILADNARLVTTSTGVYILNSQLKVMMEDDYLAINKNVSQPGDMALAVSPSRLQARTSVSLKAPQGDLLTTDQKTNISNQIYKEIILPEIEREVNEGENFAPLRQMYDAFILSMWYKKQLQQSLVNRHYSNRRKVDSLTIKGDSLTPRQIYNQYLQAYKRGVFNFIQEESVTKHGGQSPQGINDTQVIPRKYFAGGTVLRSDHTTEVNPAQLTPSDKAIIAQADLAMTVDLTPDSAMIERSTKVSSAGKSFDEIISTQKLKELNPFFWPEVINGLSTSDLSWEHINQVFKKFIDLDRQHVLLPKAFKDYVKDYDKEISLGEQLLDFAAQDPNQFISFFLEWLPRRVLINRELLDKNPHPQTRQILEKESEDLFEMLATFRQWVMMTTRQDISRYRFNKQEFIERVRTDLKSIVVPDQIIPMSDMIKRINRMLGDIELKEPVMFKGRSIQRITVHLFDDSGVAPSGTINSGNKYRLSADESHIVIDIGLRTQNPEAILRQVEYDLYNAERFEHIHLQGLPEWQKYKQEIITLLETHVDKAMLAINDVRQFLAPQDANDAIWANPMQEQEAIDTLREFFKKYPNDDVVGLFSMNNKGELVFRIAPTTLFNGRVKISHNMMARDLGVADSQEQLMSPMISFNKDHEGIFLLSYPNPGLYQIDMIKQFYADESLDNLFQLIESQKEEINRLVKLLGKVFEEQADQIKINYENRPNFDNAPTLAEAILSFRTPEGNIGMIQEGLVRNDKKLYREGTNDRATVSDDGDTTVFIPDEPIAYSVVASVQKDDNLIIYDNEENIHEIPKKLIIKKQMSSGMTRYFYLTLENDNIKLSLLASNQIELAYQYEDQGQKGTVLIKIKPNKSLGGLYRWNVINEDEIVAKLDKLSLRFMQPVISNREFGQENNAMVVPSNLSTGVDISVVVNDINNRGQQLYQRGIVFPDQGKGLNIVIIGPGSNAGDLKRMLKQFPQAARIDVIDVNDIQSEVDHIIKEQTGKNAPKIIFHRNNIINVDNIKDADAVFAFHVFDDIHWTKDNLNKAKERIWQMLRSQGPGVVILNMGNGYSHQWLQGFKVFELKESRADAITPFYVIAQKQEYTNVSYPSEVLLRDRAMTIESLDSRFILNMDRFLGLMKDETYNPQKKGWIRTENFKEGLRQIRQIIQQGGEYQALTAVVVLSHAQEFADLQDKARTIIEEWLNQNKSPREENNEFIGERLKQLYPSLAQQIDLRLSEESNPAQVAKQGGIKLSSADLDLTIEESQGALNINSSIDPQLLVQIQSANFQGFYPIIVQTRPVIGAGEILGIR